VTCDLVYAKEVPDGYGHNYDTQLADAWVEVAAPDGWDEAATARLHEALAAG
jgi:uncharacterized membrane protein